MRHIIGNFDAALAERDIEFRICNDSQAEQAVLLPTIMFVSAATH
jgi:hypothetical protein